jgi:hypothetical protein
VGRSEWGPPGEVELDLRSGRYWLTLAPPSRGAAPSAGPRVRPGRLQAAQLETVRGAASAAASQGLVEPVCAAGGRPPRIVVGNTGRTVMVLRSERGTLATHADRGCWTDAAHNLHGLLSLYFGRKARGRR